MPTLILQFSSLFASSNRAVPSTQKYQFCFPFLTTCLQDPSSIPNHYDSPNYNMIIIDLIANIHI